MTCCEVFCQYTTCFKPGKLVETVKCFPSRGKVAETVTYFVNKTNACSKPGKACYEFAEACIDTSVSFLSSDSIGDVQVTSK